MAVQAARVLCRSLGCQVTDSLSLLSSWLPVLHWEKMCDPHQEVSREFPDPCNSLGGCDSGPAPYC